MNPAASPTMTAERKILSVSQLNQRARQLLETHFSRIWVEGEISNLVCPSSGHWYFTLKDARAQVRCAMFRNRNQLLRFRAENGMKITARGRLSIYENRGDYQLIIESLEESGVGALQRAFEQLKQELATRGWFDPRQKQPLPQLPRHIGVVTSPSGAAVRDIVAVLGRRFPAIPVTLLPTPVQGDGAAAQIAEAIQRANALGATLDPPLDVLIVGRGGGSLEDLWAFNEELVASAIHHSELPVVSAVGHEIDFSIADLVADHRAATPSAAAELLSPDQDQLRSNIRNHSRHLIAAIGNHLASDRQQLAGVQKRLKHPGAQLQEYSLRLDESELRLLRAGQRALRQRHLTIEQIRKRLALLTPQGRIDHQRQRFEHLRQQLHERWQILHQGKQQQWVKNSELLHSVSPLQTLQRGYSIVTDERGSIVNSVTRLKPDEQINIRMSDGDIDAVIV